MGTIQVKNLPPELHRELLRRADRAGMTIRDYVIALIQRDQRRPTFDEWLEEVASDPPVELDEPAAEAVRAARDERDRELAARSGGGERARGGR
jgi:hypothetical protein